MDLKVVYLREYHGYTYDSRSSLEPGEAIPEFRKNIVSEFTESLPINVYLLDK